MVATYRLLSMPGGTTPGQPSGQNTEALRPAYSWAVHQVMRAQDRVLGHGRRIVASGGMDCSTGYLIPDSTDPDGATRVYPDKGTERVVGRVNKWPLTPGYFLRVECWGLPAGPTQEKIGAGDYDPDDAGGALEVSVTWNSTNATSESSDYLFTWQPSQRDNNAVSTATGIGSRWYEAYEPQSLLMAPDGVWSSVQTLRNWTGPGVTADIVISEKDSPRIVQWIIYEVPFAAAKGWADSDWALHGYSDLGAELQGYPLEHPLDESDILTDPALGSRHLLDVARQQHYQLGPSLFYWSSFSSESATLAGIVSYDSGTGDDEIEPVTTTSTTYEHLTRGSQCTTWSTDAPGWAIGSGAYGARYAQAASEHVMPGGNSVVPLVVDVYWKTSAGTASLKLQSAPYSYVELTTNSTSYGWTRAVWWARCGRGPQDNVTAVPFIKTTSGTASIRYIHARYLSESAP